MLKEKVGLVRWAAYGTVNWFKVHVNLSATVYTSHTTPHMLTELIAHAREIVRRVRSFAEKI